MTTKVNMKSPFSSAVPEFIQCTMLLPPLSLRDVCLATMDAPNKYGWSNRSVLAAASPFFRTLLKDTEPNNFIVYLDCSFETLCGVLSICHGRPVCAKITRELKEMVELLQIREVKVVEETPFISHHRQSFLAARANSPLSSSSSNNNSNKFACQFCPDVIIADANDAVSHTRIHLEALEAKFIELFELDAHYACNDYVCPACKQVVFHPKDRETVLGRREMVVAHNQVCNSELDAMLKAAELAVLQCDICQRSYKTNFALKKHKETHRRQVSTPDDTPGAFGSHLQNSATAVTSTPLPATAAAAPSADKGHATFPSSPLSGISRVLPTLTESEETMGFVDDDSAAADSRSHSNTPDKESSAKWKSSSGIIAKNSAFAQRRSSSGDASTKKGSGASVKSDSATSRRRSSSGGGSGRRTPSNSSAAAAPPKRKASPKLHNYPEDVRRNPGRSCLKCAVCFDSDQALLEHVDCPVKTDSGNMSMSKRSTHVCVLCPASPAIVYENYQDLKLHLVLAHYQPYFLKKVFGKSGAIFPMPCDLCEEGELALCRNSRELAKHRGLDHKELYKAMRHDKFDLRHMRTRLYPELERKMKRSGTVTSSSSSSEEEEEKRMKKDMSSSSDEEEKNMKFHHRRSKIISSSSSEEEVKSAATTKRRSSFTPPPPKKMHRKEIVCSICKEPFATMELRKMHTCKSIIDRTGIAGDGAKRVTVASKNNSSSSNNRRAKTAAMTAFSSESEESDHEATMIGANGDDDDMADEVTKPADIGDSTVERLLDIDSTTDDDEKPSTSGAPSPSTTMKAVKYDNDEEEEEEEVEYSYKCSICQCQFARITDLGKHIKDHKVTMEEDDDAW